jgi:hypothetical protein
VKYIDEYFFLHPCSIRDDVIYDLRSLCQKVAGLRDEGSPIEWMLALPLYHFLKEQSKPFGKPILTTCAEWESDVVNLGLNSAKQKAKKLGK